MKSLSYLIVKCDWNGVYQRIQSSPEEASIPIPTEFDGTVYALHQAVYSTENPVPKKILLLIIEAFPIALDLSVFIVAYANVHLSRGSMEVLLDQSSKEIFKAVSRNAHNYVRLAVKKKNTSFVELFIDRFPNILRGDILSYTCIYGTAELVDEVIRAGIHHNIDNAGGLFLKNCNKEDALDVAIRLYDEKDSNRRNILVKCVQYVNAIHMGMKTPDPMCSVILAAIGVVPRHVLESFLRLYSDEISNISEGGKHVMNKVIHMMNEKKDDNALPSIFSSAVLHEACSNGNADLVHKLLEESAHNSSGYISKEDSKAFFLNVNRKDALEVAMDMYDKNNNASCQILRNCIQYANAAVLETVPSSNYPTILAAIGVVPRQALLPIIRAYKHELNMLDLTGKLALKKMLVLVDKEAKYANRLDMRGQYRLSIETSHRKFRGSLSTIRSL